MKRRLKTAIALLLAALLLSGCSQARDLTRDLLGAFGLTERSAKDESMPVFGELRYERVDTAAMQERLSQLERELERGSYGEVKELLDACYDDYYHFLTMYHLAYIRSCQDLTDTYYAEEYAWCDEELSTASQVMEDMFYLCAASDMALELEEKYFWEGFVEDYGDDSEAVYDEELVALLREESSLMTRYRALMAGVNESGEGEEIPDLTPDQEDRGAYDGTLRFYKKYNRPAAEIFIQLVRVRQQLAEKLGYDNYEQMAYDYEFSRDYSPEQAAAYLEEIKTWLVPLYREIQADYSYTDYAPLSTRRLQEAMASGAEAMGGDIDQAFRFMEKFQLWDVEARPEKAATSFQNYLAEYEAPFLFLDAEGDMKDLVNCAHEFGHYVDAYANFDADESLDVSETFSQAMEYLILGYLDEVLDEEEREELYRIKMEDTLDLYVQQGSFAEFEHLVYACNPDSLSVDSLNALFLRMTQEYGYCEAGSEDYYSMSWMDIEHFFDSPFYIITYPVSNDIAMQIYELEQEQAGSGLEKYLEILPRDYTGLIDTVTAGGLQSPFAPGRIRAVAEDLEQRLGGLLSEAA